MLEVKNIVCGYGSKFRLAQISFTVEDKSFVGIIGPNGSGKTTLFRAITKGIKLENGEIFLEQKNIHHLTSENLSKKIAVVTQNPNAGLEIKVEDYVLMGRIPYRNKYQFFESQDDFKTAEHSMIVTDTIQFRDRMFSSLSGGEMQMTIIARALAQKPVMLLLDEPTNHLDIAHQVRMLDLLKKLNREKALTVLIVLHDLNLASEYCDKIILLNHGTIYKHGTPEEVLTYQNIEEVYNTAVLVNNNPISGKPCIFLVSENEKEQERKRRKE